MTCFQVIQSSVSPFISMAFCVNDHLCCPVNAPPVSPCDVSPCATNTNTQIDTQSLDHDLPPVSEALALPFHLISGRSAITAIPHIPRVTVRATTDEGETIYLRKRKRHSPLETTVSQSCIECSYNSLTYKVSDYINSKDRKFACSSYSQTYG
jgi:hypothetical protein